MRSGFKDVHHPSIVREEVLSRVIPSGSGQYAIRESCGAQPDFRFQSRHAGWWGSCFERGCPAIQRVEEPMPFSLNGASVGKGTSGSNAEALHAVPAVPVRVRVR